MALARRVVGRLAALRGFIAAPGAISLLGGAAAAVTIWADAAGFAPEGARFSPDTGRVVLSTLAGAGMSALSLVYSIVLVVFTLAAGTIAPRLLARFSKDRTSQFAVGVLGALFIHAAVGLAFVGDKPAFWPVVFALALGVLAVLLLLVFVDRVANRVTIDREIAEIADELDRRIASAASTHGVDVDEVARIDGPEAEVRAPRSGYVAFLEVGELVEALARLEATVDFNVATGDHVIEGDRIALAMAPDAKRVELAARRAVAAVEIEHQRTPEGDLRFSANLLAEIALRALSPGVNDTFTAIACVDRFAASMAEASRRGLNPGVHLDDAGAARVTSPRAGVARLIAEVFDPLRRASGENLLMLEAMGRALDRLAPHLDGDAREEAARQLELIAARLDASTALEADKARVRAAVFGG